MNNDLILLRCNKCGSLVEVIDGSGELNCCLTKMDKLVANTVDAAAEKHVPVYDVVGEEIIVRVGEVPHPMDEEHHIEFIAMVHDGVTERVRLDLTKDNSVKFRYIKGSTIYAYCNKHGLWKNDVK